MDFIQEWVTQIIIFLLIAMFIELLLPQSAMQKYVKFAVGLILVLVFLQPLFTLFNVNAQQFFENNLPSYSDTELEELKNSIENQKNEIQASQHAYILNQIVVQLKEQAEGELIDKYGVGIKDIFFTFSDEKEEPSFENVEQLQVIVEKVDHTPEGEVEEVIIDFEEDQTDQNLPLEDIKSELASFWEISKEKINLTWEGGEAS